MRMGSRGTRSMTRRMLMQLRWSGPSMVRPRGAAVVYGCNTGVHYLSWNVCSEKICADNL